MLRKILTFALLTFIVLGLPSYAKGELVSEYYYRGEWGRAIGVLWENLKSELSDWQDHADLATIYYDRYQYAEAQEEYVLLVNLFPDNLYFREKLGAAYLNLGQWKEAEEQYREILRRKDDYANAWFGLGRIYQAEVREKEALDAYQKAAELDTRYVEAYIRQGEIYEEMGEWDKAVEVYQKVLKIDSSYIFLHLRLGSIYEKMEDYARALARYEKWLSIFPADEEIRTRKKAVAARIPEFVEQEELKKEEQRQTLRNITVAPVVTTASVPEVMVSLGDSSWVGFKCGADFSILDVASEKVLFQGKTQQIWEIFARGEDWIIKNRDEGWENKFYTPIIIVPSLSTTTIALFDVSYGQGYFWAGYQNRQYRGKIIIVPRGKGGFRVINRINLEEYLYSVVPGEILSNWSPEALKAQAVVARTVAIANLGRHRQEGYDFCSGVHCAVYSGAMAESTTTTRAVDETRGEILAQDGKIITAFFSSNCGGHTQEAGEAWGYQNSFSEGVYDGEIGSENTLFPLRPYQLDDWINGKPDVFCNSSAAGSNTFRWRITFKKSELEKIIHRRYDIGELIAIYPGPRSSAGFVQKVVIVGSKGNFEVKNDIIRSTLGGLKSNLFKIEVKVEDGKIAEYTFIGGGWGHGVGMCQTGAGGMAVRGYDYHQILAHYFPGAVVSPR